MPDDSSDSYDDFLRAAARAPDVGASPCADLVGQTLGRYEVLSRLGRGAMGVVYRARDPKLHRDVALKVLPPDRVDDPERRQRFLREARLSAAVAHPSLVTLHDVGEDAGRIFLAMELVAGETLREALARGPLPVGEAIRIGAELAGGLARAHEEGIVHRDLKPDNVMLGRAGEVKVLDFGLAKLREREWIGASEAMQSSVGSRDGEVVGTPAYMSPEQAKGLAVTDRSDVFALGVLLYELVTGVQPFRGTTRVELAISIDRDEPPPPSAKAGPAARELDAIVLRCLSKRPDDRPSSAEVARDLVAARAAVSSRPGTRNGGPSRAWTLAALAASVGVGAVVWGGWPSPAPSRDASAPTANVALDPRGPLAATSPAPTPSTQTTATDPEVVAPASAAASSLVAPPKVARRAVPASPVATAAPTSRAVSTSSAAPTVNLGF